MSGTAAAAAGAPGAALAAAVARGLSPLDASAAPGPVHRTAAIATVAAAAAAAAAPPSSPSTVGRRHVTPLTVDPPPGGKGQGTVAAAADDDSVGSPPSSPHATSGSGGKGPVDEEETSCGGCFKSSTVKTAARIATFALLVIFVIFLLMWVTHAGGKPILLRPSGLSPIAPPIITVLSGPLFLFGLAYSLQRNKEKPVPTGGGAPTPHVHHERTGGIPSTVDFEKDDKKN